MQAIVKFFRYVLGLVYRKKPEPLAQRLLQRVSKKP